MGLDLIRIPATFAISLALQSDACYEKIALIYKLMICIPACALYVHTQQNAVCHTHLPSVTQSLNDNLRVGGKKNQNEYSCSHCSPQSPGFKASAANHLNSIFVSLSIRGDGELNLQ